MALNFPASPVIGDSYASGNTTWQYDGVAWDIVQSSSSLVIPNSFNTITVDGQDNVVAATTNDILTLVAGTNVTMTTDAATDSITINSSGGSGGSGAVDNAWLTINGDTGAVVANSATDALTIEGGTNITTSAANDTLTIDFSGALGSATFSGTTDASTASLSVDKIYMHAICMLVVDNTGTSAYTFNSHYSGNNPTIYGLAGTTIAFDLSLIGGHPFEIQSPTSSAYNIGVVHVAPDGTVSTGANAQGKSSGTLYWQIPESISGTYRYQCQNHIAMVGGINIKRLSVI